MLKLVQENIGGLIVWCVSEVIAGFPSGSWAKFSSETVARNFMRWLQTLDTEALVRRLLTGLWNEADKRLYALIIRRSNHISRVVVIDQTGTYWQRYYPGMRF